MRLHIGLWIEADWEGDLAALEERVVRALRSDDPEARVTVDDDTCVFWPERRETR